MQESNTFCIDMFEVASVQIFEFGEFRLDNTRRLLLKNGEVVPLTHKAFEMLALMVANSGRIVEKDELLREIWPDTFVEEGSLSRNISVLRKALGEGPSDHQYIQTIPKQGYRFVAPVREVFGSFEPDSIEPEIDIDDRINGSVVEPALNGKRQPAARNPMPYAIAAGILAAFVVTGIAFYFSTRPTTEATPDSMTVTRFTNTGKALDAAISQDGKYVAYVIADGGKQSIWVKQVASGSEVQIVQPADVSFQGLDFTSDGNYVYYNVWDKVHVGEIYRIPVLGGPSTKVVNDVMPSMSLSPDDKEIVFVRSVAATSESMLMAAKTDGSGERTISTLGHYNKGWFGGPAWSPDGKTIAFARGDVGERGQSFVHVAGVPADGGDIRRMSDRRFLGIGAIAWHSNGRDLIVSASEQLQTPNQIWRLNSSTGEAKQISNDLNGYNGVSVTADSKSLITTQGDFQSNVFVGGDTPGSEWKRLTSGRYEGLHVTWAPSGRLLYVSRESGNEDIWIVNADGSGRKRLTTDPGIEAFPTVASDQRTLIFVSLRSGVPHIFKMNIDGGDQAQLTNGTGEWAPVASPTEPTFLFQASNDRGILKMNLDGSGQTRLTDFYSYLVAFSPDGTRVALSYWDDKTKPEQLRQAIIDLKSGEQKLLPGFPKTAIRQNSDVILKWSPDGKSVAYIDDRDGVSNIWRQPVDGGPPQQITNFNDSYIYAFDWSRDGRLATARGTFTFDVVLITNFE